MTFKELRRASGMTQQQFADYFGIPKRTIENWDAGVNKCPQYLLELMKYKLDKESKKQQILDEYIRVVESFKEADESNIYERSTRIDKDLNDLNRDCTEWIAEFKALLNK